MWAQLAPPGEYDLTCASFGQPESTIQTANRPVQAVQPFFHNSLQKVHIQWAVLPQKLPLAMGDLDPRLMHGAGPTRVLNPNGVSIGSAAFAGLNSVTDRLTERQTTLLGW